MALPFDDDDVPSEAELRVAQAQLVGWLEGLFHGIQATLVAQQMAARAQLDEMRQRGRRSSPRATRPVPARISEPAAGTYARMTGTPTVTGYGPEPHRVVPRSLGDAGGGLGSTDEVG